MTDKIQQILSKSVDQTIQLGRSLGRELKGGEVIAMVGTLGTGKTHLIKGIALGLEVTDTEQVTSPTFTLINEYQGRLPMYHIDAYRLENDRQLESLGFDEICAGSNVVVVEWADRVCPLINEYRPIRINIKHQGENERMISFDNML